MIIDFILISDWVFFIWLGHRSLLPLVFTLSIFVVSVPFFISQILLCLSIIMWWRVWLWSLIVCYSTRINVYQSSTRNSNLIIMIFNFNILFCCCMTSAYSSYEGVGIFTLGIVALWYRLVTITYRLYGWTFSISTLLLLLLWILILILVCLNNIGYLILDKWRKLEFVWDMFLSIQ